MAASREGRGGDWGEYGGGRVEAMIGCGTASGSKNLIQDEGRYGLLPT